MALVTVLENGFLFDRLGGNTKEWRDAGEIYVLLSNYCSVNDKNSFVLDEGGVYIFETNEPEVFCAALLRMVKKHRIEGHFTVAVSDNVRIV